MVSLLVVEAPAVPSVHQVSPVNSARDVALDTDITLVIEAPSGRVDFTFFQFKINDRSVSPQVTTQSAGSSHRYTVTVPARENPAAQCGTTVIVEACCAVAVNDGASMARYAFFYVYEDCPTPTPLPPTFTPTPTSTPTATLTPIPTATPTISFETPTPFPAPPSPTMVPTATPTPQPTQAPPTQTPVPDPPGARLRSRNREAPASLFLKGQPVAVELAVALPFGGERAIGLYVALEHAGRLYFYPEMTAEPGALVRGLAAEGFSVPWFPLLEFESPEVEAPLTLSWYALMIDESSGEAIGELAAIQTIHD